MAQTRLEYRQITKKILLFSVFVTILNLFHSCQTGTEKNEQREWCIHKTDTLWMGLASVRKNFTYKMDEIALRKGEMDSQMRKSLFINPGQLSEVEVGELNQYHSVLKVYEPIAEEYKKAVLEAEEMFFRIKTLDKAVKEGYYDQKLAEFKSTWQEIDKELRHNLEESEEIAGKLSSVEPMYQRLAPKVDALLSRLFP